MASLGVLASLMQGLTPTMPQYDPLEVQKQRTANQTGLITLADLKAKQSAEQEFLLSVQNDPRVREALFGGSVLGSLQTAPGGMAAPDATQPGPITQGAPGQNPRGFAPEGGGPAQSILGSLGPAGQPQMQAPQNPLLEMAATNPRAAMMLQQQMQAQQDRQWKLQEQQLSNGVKVAEYVSRMLQGVTNQETLDQAREQIRLVHPQAASQLPQMYSKEGVAALQQRGASITEMAQNRYHEAKARNLDMETQMFPELAKRFGLGDDVSGTASEGAPATTAASTTGQQARTAPAEYESAITEATRLYPEVKPERIKSIIAAESNFDAKAVSPAGAQGPMQLMPGTAKDMGVDDPFNIQQNVRGGTRYYAQMLTRYGGDERKALAAYNWGPGNLDKVNGDVSKAPPETQAYVAKVLGGGGGTTGTAQATPADPRIAQLETKIAQRTRDAQIASLMKNESLSTRLNDDATRLTAEKNRLIDQNRHTQERAEETPRALERERLITEQKQNLERQRQAGPMLPDDRRKLLTGLRTDIRAEPTFKTYQEIRNGYQNVSIGAERDSSEGDLALIYGIAKILDPGSVVRESEFATVAAAQGKLQQLLNTPKKFFEGDRLTPENRQQLLAMAHRLANEKLTTAQKELRAVYEPLAKEGNIDFGQLLPLEDIKPLATATSALTPAQQALINKHRTP